jgi:hypothetical protein
MAKNENKTITVNDVEHNIEDLTEQQIDYGQPRC